jgi:hypothetical protein
MNQTSKNKIYVSSNFLSALRLRRQFSKAHISEHLMSNIENGTVYLLYIEAVGESKHFVFFNFYLHARYPLGDEKCGTVSREFTRYSNTC